MLETLLNHLNMARLSVGAAAVVALVGCTGVIDNSHGTQLTPEQQMAQDAWTNLALPHFQTDCVGCHGGSMADVAFLSGATPLDVRTTLLGYDPQVVNLDAPQSSRVLTKGVHDGPALQAQEASDILQWITLEKAAANVGDTTPTLETAPFTVLLCTGGNAGDPTCPINHVALMDVGITGGAEIDFVAQALGSGLYLNELQLVAGTDGAYIEHPLFVSHPALNPDPVPDSLDRYFDVKMNLMPSTNGDIDGGTAAFVGFVATDPISITFKIVDKYRPDTSGGTQTGGCKVLDQFKNDAQGPLTTNCAQQCHGGADSGAKSAMNLSTLLNPAPISDADILLSCNEVHSRINLTDVEQSGFFIAPNPGNATNHPFKFNGNQANYQSFHDTILPWVNAEKTAP